MPTALCGSPDKRPHCSGAGGRIHVSICLFICQGVPGVLVYLKLSRIYPVKGQRSGGARSVPARPQSLPPDRIPGHAGTGRGVSGRLVSPQEDAALAPMPPALRD